MCLPKTLWQQAVDFHGHSCMGLAIGFRVAEAAMQALDNLRDVDEEMVAIVENDNCSIDAIQVVTGCTLGKGNLIFQDYGKQVYTFILRKIGKSVRITAKSPDEEKHRDISALREKARIGQISEEDRELLRSKIKSLMEAMLSSPLEKVCEIQEIECNIPQKARIFSSVTCSCCGEKVMEPRARVKNGLPACIPCSEKYGRGWGQK